MNSQFTEGKIVGPLIKFVVPVFLAMCLQSLYGAVDLFVVGQFGHAADVSAVSTGTQMMQMMIGVVANLSMGTTIMLGQSIGSGKSEEAGDIVKSSILFFGVLAIVSMVVMLRVASPFATLMNAPKEAFKSTIGYVQICSLGMTFIVAYNVLGSIFRGIGDSKTPLMTVAIACVVNIVGDLILVGVFHLNAYGAAIATVFAQAVSVILSVIIIKKKGLPFKLGIVQSKMIKKVVQLGFPIALQGCLVSVSFLVLGSIVNSLGVIVSAGVGVAEKICAFIMLVPSAFSQALSTFVSQNMGARKPERARLAMYYSIGLSLAAGLVMAYISFFHGSLLGRIFATNQDVIYAGAEYLKAYAIDTILVSVMFCYMGYMNGCEKTTFVMLQGIIGAFLVRIPISFVMSRMTPISIFGIGLATPASTLVQIILFVLYDYYLIKKSGE